MNVKAISAHAAQRLWAGLPRWGLLALLAVLQACATVAHPNPKDPLESWNRGVFGFNDTLDRAVVKPVATAYHDVLPHWLRTGIGNFFGNLGDVWSGVNNALQGRGLDTADSFGRFAINTTFGLGGILDIASEMGMERHSADFGLTLGRWGVKSGPYLVLPFLGSSTLRDTAGLALDVKGNLLMQIDDVPTRDALTLLKLIDTRATYLKAGDVVDGAALDKYSFTRDAYLQVRRNQVYDGNPPDDDDMSESAPDDDAAPTPAPASSDASTPAASEAAAAPASSEAAAPAQAPAVSAPASAP